MNSVKRVLGWTGRVLIAVIVTVIMAVAMQTQRVIGGLNNAGASVPFGERLSMTVYDISHLGTLYGVFIFIAFVIAFLAAARLFQAVEAKREIIYVVAGAVAMFVMLMLMKKAFFDVHIIAGARDGLGIALQMLAGAIGGYVFARLTGAEAIKKEPVPADT